MNARPKILWVDDEAHYPFVTQIQTLEAEGYDVVEAKTVDEARAKVEGGNPSLVIIDLMMNPPKDLDGIHCAPASGGVWFGKWLRRNHISIPFIGISSVQFAGAQSDRDFFYRYGSGRGYFPKSAVARAEDLMNVVKEGLGKRREVKDLRCFIVHGTSRAPKIELKDYLREKLGIVDPIILDQRASGTNTIIEKFEHYAEEVDVAFVLLLPEDNVVAGNDDGQSGYSQARPNVFFELGYFLGHFGRAAGRVFLLHHKAAKLPTDLSGIVYIDISNGIEQAGEKIRQELAGVIERMYEKRQHP